MSTNDHSPIVLDLHKRVGRLEDEVRTQAKESAQAKTEMAVMGRDISHIRESTDKVTAGINRILWAIGLTAVGMLTTFVLSGGLTNL